MTITIAKRPESDLPLRLLRRYMFKTSDSGLSVLTAVFGWYAYIWLHTAIEVSSISPRIDRVKCQQKNNSRMDDITI